MGVHFDLERMARVLDAHELWWAGKLERPLLQIRVDDAYPTESAPRAPVLSQATCADFSWSPEEIIDALDHQLSGQEYLGDAYPYVNMDSFGPGVLAAFCGARLDNSSGGVWFFPEDKRPISETHAVYQPDCIWAKRIRDIYRAGVARWQGTVVMGMPDLGGVLDVAASLIGTDELLFALIDEPEEVKRLTGEIHRAWHEAYRDFATILSAQGAYTDWGGLLSKGPSYILQCDFSYMIGNKMFREFALETLREDTRLLERTIYHLDGIGELTHLDDILSLEDLDAVQWVYGAGKPKAGCWLDVYRRILDAGKQIFVIDGEQEFWDVYRALGGSPYSRITYPASRRADAVALCDKFGI